jgi:hypothetical protein
MYYSLFVNMLNRHILKIIEQYIKYEFPFIDEFNNRFSYDYKSDIDCYWHYENFLDYIPYKKYNEKLPYIIFLPSYLHKWKISNNILSTNGNVE